MTLRKNPFFIASTGELHPRRRKQILALHPEVRKLFGYDRRTAAVIVVLVSLHSRSPRGSTSTRCGAVFGV